jgi:predicted Zn-dependent protease
VAAECEFRRQWFAASFHLKYLIDAEPNDSILRLRRSDAFAQQKRWREAAGELERAFVLAPSSSTLSSLGYAQLAAGNDAAFYDICRKLFEKDSRSMEPGTRD